MKMEINLQRTDIPSIHDALILEALKLDTPLHEITHLYLDNSNLQNQKELDQLKHLPNLVTLSLTGLHINYKLINSLENTPNDTLKKLHCLYIDCTEIEDLSILRVCENLELLHAQETPITLFYTPSSNTSTLIELNLSDTN